MTQLPPLRSIEEIEARYAYAREKGDRYAVHTRYTLECVLNRENQRVYRIYDHVHGRFLGNLFRYSPETLEQRKDAMNLVWHRERNIQYHRPRRR
jgi:hypothetical protein